MSYGCSKIVLCTHLNCAYEHGSSTSPAARSLRSPDD